jgi:signal transduction histidine kinase
MSWIAIAWPMVSAACLTLGLIELRLGLAQPPRAARLLFALSALAMAASAGAELGMMQANTAAQAAASLYFMDAAVGVVLVSLAAFVWVYFGTGNKWLGLAVPGFYAAGLVFDLLPGSGMTYQAITGMRSVQTFGGASFSVLEGVPNPWNVLPYLAALALLVFVADASLRLWRRGGRRRALVVGGSITTFLLLAGVHTALLETGIVSTPYMISWAYLAILLAMASDLNADVLAAARLARELQESESRMDLAGAAAETGMWEWNVADDSVWATARARALFGISASGTLSPDQFTNALHPDDREVRRQAIELALTTGADYEAEYRVLLAEGQTRWISSRGRVDLGADGKPLRIRGVVLDVSARRSTELELQSLQSQLAHASRVSMMGQLASALAHELSQPLGAILRNAEAAELFLKHDRPDLNELRAILIDIRHDDQRAGAVIERLRALLKRRSIAPQELSVIELLDNAAALTRLEASRRKVQIDIEPAPALAPVMGDAVQLQQVLLNLVLNAMDAVEDVATERRMVSVSARLLGEDGVEVAVADAGHGIAPEKLARLFEPFFTTKANGMGIGLSISRTIVEAHGGRIWAENNAGAGATFRFTLPLAPVAATP